jgi:hypothetical protein
MKTVAIFSAIKCVSMAWTEITKALIYFKRKAGINYGLNSVDEIDLWHFYSHRHT